MKTKWFKLFILSALVLSLLTGCSHGANDARTTGGTPETETGQGSGGKKDASSDIQLGEPFELSTHLASGSFQVTVKSAKRITDVSELPPQDMFLEYYDNHVLSDGTMKEGSCFVLLTLEVRSLDAEGRPEENDSGDTHQFRADSFLTLIDRTEKQGKNYYYIPTDYFSLFGRLDPEHSFAFELEPGETIEFDVGYFVGKKRDGSERDLSQLRACTTSGNAKSDFIDLRLGEGQDA